MKRIIIIAATLAGLAMVGCQSNSSDKQNAASDSLAQNAPKTKIEFEETKFDFGKITQGSEAKHIFKFKNAGENPLMLTKVSPSCGCTVPKYSSEPVAPGAWGEIEVVFNTKKKEGVQNKSVTVEANTEPSLNVLQFTADVIVDSTAKK